MVRGQGPRTKDKAVPSSSLTKMLRYKFPWLLSMLTRMTRASEVCCPRRGIRGLLRVKVVEDSVFRDGCRQCGVGEVVALLICVMNTTRLFPHYSHSADEHTRLPQSPHTPFLLHETLGTTQLGYTHKTEHMSSLTHRLQFPVIETDGHMTHRHTKPSSQQAPE